jgi:hypothetical protein
MNRLKPWLLLLGIIFLITSLSGCLKGTNSQIPDPRTPFPSSCTPSDPAILEIIDSFEVLANEKDVSGTMDLFADNAVVEESYRGAVFDDPKQIKVLWWGFYSTAVTTEFRDIAACDDYATFNWAVIYGENTNLWPVIMEVKDGKISFFDFYEEATNDP